jgi:hypothetical protein
MPDATLVDPIAQQNAAAEQVAIATSGVAPLDRAVNADGAAAFDWGHHTPGDLAGAYRVAAFWLAVGGRLLADRGLGLAGAKALTWATTYNSLPITLSYGVAGVLTDASSTLQAALEGSNAPALQRAEALAIVTQLRANATAAQQIADTTTIQGRIEGWVTKLEGWAKVAGLVLAVAVAGMLGWGTYRAVRWVRG